MSPDHSPLLIIDGLVKQFGGFRALDGLSFSLAAGEILGLVGPNGSGKTTCINIVSGLYTPDGGSIHFEGRSVAGLPSHRLVHAGINRTFQIPRPFLTLTVRENVDIAIAYGRNRDTRADTDALLSSLGLLVFADQPAAELNSARQKMLDLARALATGPLRNRTSRRRAPHGFHRPDYRPHRRHERGQGNLRRITGKRLYEFAGR